MLLQTGVKLAYIMVWIFGFIEYGMLSTSGMQVGCYDPIEDKYCSYLRKDLSKLTDKKKPQNTF